MLRESPVLCFSLLVLLHFAIGGENTPGSITTSKATLCSCKKSCQSQESDSTSASSIQSPSTFYFDSALSSCVRLPSFCKIDAGCTFAAQSLCETSCGAGTKDSEEQSDVEKKISTGGKSETKADCKSGNTQNCRHMDKSGGPQIPNRFPSSSRHRSTGRGVRWDLVVGGTCVMVVLVAALSVVGVVTYNYRIKKKERIRSRYIRDVLDMYDSTSDSSFSEGEQSSLRGKEARNKQMIRL